MRRKLTRRAARGMAVPTERPATLDRRSTTLHLAKLAACAHHCRQTLAARPLPLADRHQPSKRSLSTVWRGVAEGRGEARADRAISQRRPIIYRTLYFRAPWHEQRVLPLVLLLSRARWEFATFGCLPRLSGSAGRTAGTAMPRASRHPTARFKRPNQHRYATDS